MKKSVAVTLYLTPAVFVLLISAAWLSFVKPHLIQYIESRIPSLNESQDVAEVKLKSIDLSLMKLQAYADEVEINFKKIKPKQETLTVEKVKIQVDPFKLLVGQLSLSKIQIEKPVWSYEYTNKNSAEKPPLTQLPINYLFNNLLPQIPIEKLIVNNAFVTVEDKKQNFRLGTHTRQLAITNLKNRVLLDISDLSTQVTTETKNPVHFVINLSSHLTKNDFEISLFQIKNLNSEVKVSGKLTDIKNVLVNPKGEFKSTSEINLEDVRNMSLNLFPQKSRIPSVAGSVKLNGFFKLLNAEEVSGQFSIQTTQVAIDHFKLGQALLKAEVKKNQIFVNQIEIEHPSGSATLNQIEFQQKAPYNFKAQGKINSFDLQKLFVSLGLTGIPAGLNATGDVSCEGLLQPTFSASCKAESAVSNVWVKTDSKTNSHIVKIKSASLNGQFNFDQSQMTYKSAIAVGKSTGSTSGVVNFKEGFKINYETNELDFADVESLADLDFKGKMKIKGQTEGDSNRGTIDADIEYRQAQLSLFNLGNLNGHLEYRNGQLAISNISGAINKTLYLGTISFNFLEENLKGNFDLPHLEGPDIIVALKDSIPIPFNIEGIGAANISLSGPYSFWNLKYDLKSHLKQGEIAGEGFDSLTFNLNSNGQQIDLSQVSVAKSKSKLNLGGSIITTGKTPEFKIKISAQPFYLEDVEHLTNLISAISGQAWLDGSVNGPLANPELSFNFNTKQVNFEGIDYPGSQGQVEINKNYLKFAGQILGRQIQSDLRWPWNENEPYYLKTQIHDLNPLLFLPFISLPLVGDEFYSRINADIDLRSDRRSLKSSDGQIKIHDFLLQRGGQTLKLSKSVDMTFKNGLSRMDPVELKSDDSFLKLTMLSAKNNEFKFSFDSDIQLRLFQFLVPFAQTLSGQLKIESQVLLKNENLELVGDGELNDGLINLKGFPQSIENISSPLEFSKSKIFLNEITGTIGQSEISGVGQIDIRGHRDIGVNVHAEADNIELIFPEQITTAGKADLKFFGNWLPYTLKVNYKVARGLVEKDFGDDTSQGKSLLKASQYLPPQQIEQQTPSLLLDVAVDLTQGIIVKNQIIEGEASGTLQITGSPEYPLINGKIDIKKGSKLFFKDKPFEIQTATIHFPPSKEINPEIYITANSRVSDYDINLLVQGPAKNLSIQPTSQPPLSKDDIFSLLALGITSSKIDQNLSSETQQQQTGLEVLAAISNKSQLNKKIQEKLGLTVQLAPTVDSTKNIAVPKVVVSKKLQKNVNASFSRPLSGESQNQEWKLQYLFNANRSVILNYQNKEATQQEQIRNSNTNDTGVLGFDFEYKKEFK